MFRDACVLITGGTGTIGRAFAKHCINAGAREVRIFSRNEEKQSEMAQDFAGAPLSFFNGDIRNSEAISEAMQGVDYVLHAAAMKSIPACEYTPNNAILTNIVGTTNVIQMAKECKVKKVVCLSSDKAVYPTSVMGMTKALMEKIALQASQNYPSMEVAIVRLNNLIASNGSAIPAFIHKILNNKPLTITDPEMTRFFMTTKRAVELIEEAFNYAGNGEILINYTFPCKLDDIVKAVLQLMNVADDYPREIIGPRLGEKKFEYLITQEEKPFIHNYANTLIYNPDAPGCFNSTVCSHEMPLLTVKEIVSMISEEEL